MNGGSLWHLMEVKIKMENELYHYGILGMKWGVRRSRPSSSGSTNRSRKKQTIDPSYKKAHTKKKLKYMSDDELREINKRLNMEKNYKDLTRTKGKGKKVVDAFVGTAGTIAAVMGAYGTYKKYGGKLLNKIGNMKV